MDKKEFQEAQSIIDALYFDGKVITGWQHTLLQNVISIAQTKLCQTDDGGFHSGHEDEIRENPF